MIIEMLGANPLVIQLPIGAEDYLEGVVDLVAMKELVYMGEDLGATWEVRDIRESMQDECQEWREKLIETAVEQVCTPYYLFFGVLR